MPTIRTPMTKREMCERIVNEIKDAYSCRRTACYIGLDGTGSVDYEYFKQNLVIIIYNTDEWTLGDLDWDETNSEEWTPKRINALVEAFESDWLMSALGENNDVIFRSEDDLF